jgi:hypothetical protein
MQDGITTARVCILCMLILCLAAPVWGQLYTGSISGLVVDPSGAVVPNAKVAATDTERSYAYKTVTDQTGRYAIRALPPGQYTLSVEAEGFANYMREKFAVAVNASVTVDAQLRLASGTQTVVVVDSGAPLLQTENAAIGQTIDRKFINDLPLVGRGVADLIYLSPGITQPAGKAYGPGGATTGWISNGTRNGQSDILLDGLSMTAAENNGGTTNALLTPNVDNVQEFKVQQGNFSAEFGQTGSTIVNMVSRSGTNAFHGSAYEFIRNKVTDANNYFANAAGQELGAVHKNNFGGTVGGPIKKDKTFFFFDYDETRQVTSGQGRGAVPTDLQRRGDFSELCGYYGGTFDSAGRCSAANGQIWDPFTAQVKPDYSGWTRQNFIPFNNIATYISPGNPLSPQGRLPATPGNLLDPVAAKLMTYYPKPNLAPGAPGYDPLFNNWLGTGTVPSRSHGFDLKVDHQFNPNNMLSAKYMRQWGHNDNGANLFGNAGDTNTQGQGRGSLQAGVVNFTRTVSPTTILTVTAGISRNYAANDTLLNCCFTDVDPVTTLGMPEYIMSSGYKALPMNYIENYQSVGNQAWSNFTTGSETRHLVGSITHIVGRHELKAGGELRLHYLNMLFNGAPAGIFNFSRWGTAETQTWSGGEGGGNGLATFMMGMNDGWGQYEIPPRPAVSAKTTAGFLNDNWKVTEKLTVNLGLRYDIEFPRTERYDRMSFFDPDAPAPLPAVAALPNLKGAFRFTGHDGVGRSITETWCCAIQPRLGFAYRLGTNTSVRGGYGIYYDQALTGMVGLSGNSFSGYSAVTDNSTVNWASTGVPGSFLRDPYPNGLQQPLGAAYGPGLLLGQAFKVPVPNRNRIPQEQSWSIGVQHQLPWATVAEATYIGKKGTHLYMGGYESLNYLPASAAERFLADPVAANEEVPNPLAGQPGQKDTIQQFRLWLPYPQYGTGYATGADSTIPATVGNSIYHSLQLKAEKRFSSGVQFLASWVWSKSIDDSSVVWSNIGWMGGSASLQNPNNLRLERALSQFNIPHAVQLAWVYELPFGRGKVLGRNVNRIVDLALGGWQFNGTYRWDSGQPLAIGLNNPQPLPTYGQRPNMLGELKQNPGVNLDQYFANPEVIGVPERYAFGNASRTDPHLRAPGTNVMSASLFKAFPLAFRDGARAELRLEFFNALNHPTFAAPNTTLGDPNFGKVTGQANTPREGQLALKLYF